VTSPGPIPEDWFLYKIRVLDARGRTAPPSAEARARDKRLPLYSGSFFARELPPGGSFVDQITVTHFYDLSRPGKYTVSVARAIDTYDVGVEGLPPEKLPKGIIRSNAVSIAVIE